MTRLRSYAEVKALTELTSAEKRLLRECQAGVPTDLGRVAPTVATDANRVRAEILRYLILAGCKDCRPDETGVRLRGAYVTGTLDLSFATAKGATYLLLCHFDTRIEAAETHFAALILSGSRMPGLFAQGARVTGNVFLNGGFHATGEVSLSGAEIVGQLDCEGGRFENGGGQALNAQGVRVTGGLLWRNLREVEGRVSLSSARVGDLVDDLASWPVRDADGGGTPDTRRVRL